MTVKVSESGALLGIQSRPKSKMHARLLSVRRSWSQSLTRIILLELCNLFLRIREIRRNPSVRFGAVIPPALEGRSVESFPQVSSFLCACTESMEHLRHSHSWCGVLEVQMAAQAFQHGARWARDRHKSCNENGSEQSCGKHTSLR